MIFRLTASIFFSLVLTVGLAAAAEISLEKFDLFDDRTHHLHIEGSIERGDAARIRDLTRGLPEGRNAILAVSLNSPGGDVQEGLDIARDFQGKDMQVVMDVMTRDGKPGSCASACSYIFLGGSYRFLLDGSKLGVHQFRYVEDRLMPLSETTRDVQALSADITSLLSDARVDPGFFSLMGATAPEEMTWVDVETLERLNVVNRELDYQDNDFTLTRGQVQLVMTHIGLFGVNRLTALCAAGDVVFTSEILLSERLDIPAGPEAADAIAERFNFTVMVDRYKTGPQIGAAQSYDGNGITTQFTLPANHLATLLTTELVDIRLVEESGIFIGAGFDVSDGRVRDIVESCVKLKPQPASTLGGAQDVENTLSPVLVAASLGAARRGIQLPEVLEPQVTPEEAAKALYNAYLTAWSEQNSFALDFMNAHYANVLDFYGNAISKVELMAEKRSFAERWPDRLYAARPGTFEISCKVEGTCLVAALIDWEAHSAARGKSASGVAWYGLGFDMLTGEVLFEDGKSRRR
jgi:hypothetical protein